MTRKEIADKMNDIIWDKIALAGHNALRNGDAINAAVEEIMQLWDMGFVYELDRKGPTGLVGDPQ